MRYENISKLIDMIREDLEELQCDFSFLSFQKPS